MACSDVDNLHDVVWLGIPQDAVLAREVRAVAEAEANICGVLRLLRVEKLTASQRPGFGPYASVAGQHHVAPTDDLFADAVARDALALQADTIASAAGVELRLNHSAGTE